MGAAGLFVQPPQVLIITTIITVITIIIIIISSSSSRCKLLTGSAGLFSQVAPTCPKQS